MVTELYDSLAKALEQTRLISNGLHPLRLYETGLKEVLEDLFESYKRIYPQDLQLDYSKQFDIVDDNEANLIYRIIREAVFNALKHANANQICVTFKKKQNERVITIEDDGRGFLAKNSRNKGMGLKLLTYQSEQIGGQLKINSMPTHGTVITLVLSGIYD